ncbi:hypothetical protein H0H87_007356 [Tephrocybe sp. NHM501043]|nr:hypothetical protein H0H87_007356 [Tephrocybe sp. NHM501043]
MEDKYKGLPASGRPVIFSCGPPPEALEAFGNVVFANSQYQKNCLKYGVPRCPSAATTIKGKSKAGSRWSNPITLASDSPPSPPITHQTRSKMPLCIITDNEYDKNSASEDDFPLIITPPPKKGVNKAESSSSKRGPFPPQLAQSTPFIWNGKVMDDKEHLKLISKLSKTQKDGSNTPGRTAGEVIEEQWKIAEQVLQQATVNSTTVNASGPPASQLGQCFQTPSIVLISKPPLAKR